MIKPSDPRHLAVALLARSICAVKVAAVIVDKRDHIHSWGWNSVWTGFGEHAEIAAIRRANPERLHGSTIYVAASRGKPIIARPCDECSKALKRKWVVNIVWRAADGSWVKEQW